eukprot:TRINITY_DN2796_c0_g3_i1.p1 TRINITY_DN2796_c0_g3~~TRINITY_DN2796_c0_g3_i1.p1  ORF type:complete len:109 (+),score=10.11 TRINITY_DN2796_c0_g3_i1:43-369(+)
MTGSNVQQLPSASSEVVHEEPAVESEAPKLVLRLDANKKDHGNRVKWDASVKDSRPRMKTSKKCCVFHKRREFGESDSESCSSDDEATKRDRPTRCSRKECICNTTYN